MFTVLLQGGLGNRLFQIATGLGHQEKYNKQFVITPNSVGEYIPEQKGEHSYFLRNIPVVNNNFPVIHFEQPCFYYDLENLENVCFGGYFQSEKFFKHIRPKILQQFGCPFDKKVQIIQKYPQLPNSIFLHIRRGDYVNHWLHFIDLTKYYEHCLKQFENVNVLICTDDKEWCKKNYPNFQVLNENEVDTLWIMSLCGKGGICSNSSFSWWGAWLNKNPGAKFFYPNKQFNDPKLITTDLYSENLTIVDLNNLS